MNGKIEWIDEINKDSRYGLKGKLIIQVNSPYQEIIILETNAYGKALMLDGCWMTSDKQEKYYHECLVHPALSSLEMISNILIIGGGDGGTARECLKYKKVENIDLVEIDEEVIKLSKQYLNEIGKDAWLDKRLNIHISDGFKWVKSIKDNYYDVILIDISDPTELSKQLFRKDFYKECKRIMKKKGILGTQSESPESFKEIHLDIITTLNNLFKNSQTMYSFVPFYPSGIWSWTFASDNKKDFLQATNQETNLIEENCEIWNLNYQSGALKMMPNNILKILQQKSNNAF
tara:strand:- start:46 stop:915 length:870 start_codon:yes stop_codon:yes gene_type:complete